MVQNILQQMVSITLASSVSNSDIIRITSFTVHTKVFGATQGAVTQWTRLVVLFTIMMQKVVL